MSSVILYGGAGSTAKVTSSPPVVHPRWTLPLVELSVDTTFCRVQGPTAWASKKTACTLSTGIWARKPFEKASSIPR